VTDAVRRHCAEINRCNQRGGRMLSIVDLIEAGTFTCDLAAYALAAIGGGASFMVGARPGGAGKTTVMGSLLNFVPPDCELVPADSLAKVRYGLANPSPRRCWICHEIGAGRWYAYLWGDALRAYFQLPAAGHTLATNLHADSCDEAYEQVVADSRVPETAFRRMHLLFFLHLRPRASGMERTIAEVWESDGIRSHRRIFAAGGAEVDDGIWAEDMPAACKRLDALLGSGARSIEEVRAFLTDGVEESVPRERTNRSTN
jgi:hypothetical protein